MAITPSDIEKKTFSTALRGYDLDEVDDFLDEMVVAFRELQDELAEAKARVAEGDRRPDAAVVTVPSADESAVGRALVAAQEAADRILADAQAEVDRMLEESRDEADRLLESAHSEAATFAQDRDRKRAEVEMEMAEMTNLVAGVRTRLAVLATTVADKLDEMDAVVAGEVVAATAGTSEDMEPVADDDGGDAVIDVAVEEAIRGQDSDTEAVDSEEPEVGSEGVLDLEVDSLETDEDDEPAGSAEIEGVETGDEDERQI